MRVLIISLAFIFSLFTINGQEIATLTTPESLVSVTQYRFERVTLEIDDPNTVIDEGRITISLMGIQRPTGNSCIYSSTTNPTGTFLITALNKANLSTAYAGNATTGSLKQRICHRLSVMNESALVCDRPITGTCTGTVP